MAHRHVVVSGSAQVHRLSPWLSLLVIGGVLLAVHLVRALRVNEQSAVRWLGQRGLPQDGRSIEGTRDYLWRLRWSRVAATVLLIGCCAATTALLNTWISFVSLPFLLSVLIAETLAPTPRRGRLRTARLDRRSSSYFAPIRSLRVARAAIAAGVTVSVFGVLRGGGLGPAFGVVHAVVLCAGALALEASLRVASVRALPDRQPDLALDTAMRVASARTATAAALLFGVFGLMFAAGYARLGPSSHSPWLSVAVSQVLTLTLVATMAVTIALVQPLRSWRPRGSA